MATEIRLIDVDALIAYFKEQCEIASKDGEIESLYTLAALKCCIDCFEHFPTVDAVEVVHAEWVRLDAHKGMEQFKCSVCRSECYVPTCMNEPMYDYCPNCGAKMDDDGNA